MANRKIVEPNNYIALDIGESLESLWVEQLLYWICQYFKKIHELDKNRYLIISCIWALTSPYEPVWLEKCGEAVFGWQCFLTQMIKKRFEMKNTNES